MGIQASKEITVGWAALPPELVDLILRRLSSYADRLRFVSVCRHWRDTGKRYSHSHPLLPRVLPWINFCDGTFRSLPDGELHSFRFMEDELCVGSFGNWLLFEKAAGWCKPSSRHFLKNPLTGATRRLPGHCNKPVQVNPDGTCSSSSGRSTNFCIEKVIVCSSDLIAAKVRYRRQQYQQHVVVCCRPGVSSSWSTGLCHGHWYEDMAFYMDKLYTVTTDGDLFAHEVTTDRGTWEPRISRIEQVIRAPPLDELDGPYYAALNCVRASYLVVSRTGKLLMVRWIVPVEYYGPEDTTKQMTLKVFEADVEMSQWLEVENVGDQVLFVSSDCSRAITASIHNGCVQRDKVYFIDDRLMFWPSSKPRTCGVYDMSSNTVHPMSLGEVRINDHSKAVWFFI